MNKWFQSIVIISLSLLVACTTTSNTNKPPIRRVKAPAKLVRIAPEYRTDAPDRYVVKRGDTLWGIAAMFLKNPGRWKEIWHANPHIKNPNKIYPGDVISYVNVGGKRKLQIAGSSSPARNKYTGKRTADGRPIYNVSPTIETTYMDEPIPTIPKAAVYPFISKNRILPPGFSEDYPYVVGQTDGNYISLSGRSQVYAKTDDYFDVDEYDVFRESKALVDPVYGYDLGVEAVYVGKLKLVKEANADGIGTFIPMDTVNPLYPRDVLIPSEPVTYGGELNFLPKLAELYEDTIVIQTIGNHNASFGSQFSTILINAGQNEVQPGDVFRVVRGATQQAKGRGGEDLQLPDYEVAIAMVYKTFENGSYALVMNAYDVIYPGDRAVNP